MRSLQGEDLDQLFKLVDRLTRVVAENKDGTSPTQQLNLDIQSQRKILQECQRTLMLSVSNLMTIVPDSQSIYN